MGEVLIQSKKVEIHAEMSKLLDKQMYILNECFQI